MLANRLRSVLPRATIAFLLAESTAATASVVLMTWALSRRVVSTAAAGDLGDFLQAAGRQTFMNHSCTCQLRRCARINIGFQAAAVTRHVEAVLSQNTRGEAIHLAEGTERHHRALAISLSRLARSAANGILMTGHGAGNASASSRPHIDNLYLRIVGSSVTCSHSSSH